MEKYPVGFGLHSAIGNQQTGFSKLPIGFGLQPVDFGKQQIGFDKQQTGFDLIQKSIKLILGHSEVDLDHNQEKSKQDLALNKVDSGLILISRHNLEKIILLKVVLFLNIEPKFHPEFLLVLIPKGVLLINKEPLYNPNKGKKLQLHKIKK